jgi:hypothetical protein
VESLNEDPFAAVDAQVLLPDNSLRLDLVREDEDMDASGDQANANPDLRINQSPPSLTSSKAVPMVAAMDPEAPDEAASSSQHAAVVYQGSIETPSPSPDLPLRDYNERDDDHDSDHDPTTPVPFLRHEEVSQEETNGALKPPSPQAASDIDAWIASMIVPSYEAPSEHDDVESMLAALHVPPPGTAHVAPVAAFAHKPLHPC